jgi:hypothetical protein
MSNDIATSMGGNAAVEFYQQRPDGTLARDSRLDTNGALVFFAISAE